MSPNTQPTPSRDGDVQKAISVAIDATRRGDYKGALKLFRLIYDDKSQGNVPATGLSYYGVCLLKVERKTKQAIELAETAREREFYDAHHWANLAFIYLDSGSRRRAVTVLHDGLERMPKDPTLLQVREQIGYRRGSVIKFLHRDNPVNVFLGKRPHLLTPTKSVKIAIAIVWFIALMAITFYFLAKNSGF